MKYLGNLQWEDRQLKYFYMIRASKEEKSDTAENFYRKYTVEWIYIGMDKGKIWAVNRKPTNGHEDTVTYIKSKAKDTFSECARELLKQLFREKI